MFYIITKFTKTDPESSYIPPAVLESILESDNIDPPSGNFLIPPERYDRTIFQDWFNEVTKYNDSITGNLIAYTLFENQDVTISGQLMADEDLFFEVITERDKSPDFSSKRAAFLDKIQVTIEIKAIENIIVLPENFEEALELFDSAKNIWW